VGAQLPLVMALDDPGAVPGVVGGKGASLGRLARAGFGVPPGFVVTAGGYLDFIGRGGLREPVLAAASAVDVSDAAASGVAAARIGELFAGRPVPAPTAAAVAGAYACLGDEVPVAVRSSATVGDLPGMSAAGQHDTYLNVCGEAAVLDAVRRCWSRPGRSPRPLLARPPGPAASGTTAWPGTTCGATATSARPSPMS